ncbi:hypothetical protein V6N11_071828 [Hibiscus sabdariffa]|uniref:Uncharacterized protein n=1 Tax=Hibiscus sabdariffa TaxID=183260 RepID=A0ABR2U1G5_9ROSI
MCFTAPPTSPDCMVFGIDDDYPIRCHTSTIRRGDTVVTWNSLHLKYKRSFWSCLMDNWFPYAWALSENTMGNTIYFPSFDIGGNGLFYSLASRKFHSLALASAKNDLYNTKRMLHSVWITPTASEIYAEDHLRWFPNPGNFIPSIG